MDKVIHKAQDIERRIQSGIDFIVDPTVSTLGPKGTNVIFETNNLDHIMTNDGATVAKNVSSSDNVEQTVIEVIRNAALRTNVDGGDGTTTTTLLSGVLSKEALKLIKDGHSWIKVRDTLYALRDNLIKKIEKTKIEVKGSKGLLEIATISANNDAKIAEDVVKAVGVAKQDGMIFLEPHAKSETEIKEDLGFKVNGGILYQELLTDPGRNSVVFKDVPVLLTDKRLYYAEEAETILRTAVKAGFNSVVVVARDFMGEVVNSFIANHSRGGVKVMLVKAHDVTETNTEQLQDLALYIGGTVVSDKVGSLVDKLEEKDFVVVTQAYMDTDKALFTPKMSQSKALKSRIKMLQDDLAKDPENSELKTRLASLTTGIVTLKIGGNNPIETRERIYRYEDAVRSTRSAMKDGYLVGGGLSILRAFDPTDCKDKDYLPLYRKYCEAVARQIASNAGEHEDTVIKTILAGKGNYGYNALTNQYEDLLVAGVVDPYLVIKLAIENSVSVATILSSVKYYIVNDTENVETED